MSLRIAVLGTTGDPGFFLGCETTPGEASCSISGENCTRGIIRCQWIPVPHPLSLEGISCLRLCHGCLVYLPEDALLKADVQAGLSGDFRALRTFRGSDALAGQMPVLFVFPKGSNRQCSQLFNWVQGMNRELGQGFGGFYFCLYGDGIPSGGDPSGLTDISKWLGFARNYRSRSVWSTISAFFTVFCLACILLTLICGASLLLGDKTLGDWAAVQRLEFGLIPPKDTLFLVDSLEPMMARLEEMQLFMDTHPNLRGKQRARLVESRERLNGFVNAILETSDWPKVSDLTDMASLRVVTQSLKSWSPPPGFQMTIPLVVKAEAKKRLILDAWERAQEALPLLEGRLAKADQLLNHGVPGTEAWVKWVNNCDDFLGLAEPLDPGDPLWLLEEFLQARQDLQVRKKTIAGAIKLASGLGLLIPPGYGTGKFFPVPDRGDSLGKVCEIRDEMFTAVGKDSEAFFSKLGPALGDLLQARCIECRKQWLQIGRMDVREDLGQGVVSRRALQSWVEKARDSQSLKGYGDWVEWLGEFEFKGPGKKIPTATRNPIVGMQQFVALESVVLRPNRCRLTVSRDDAAIERELLIELTVMEKSSSTDYSSEGVKVAPGLWDFNFAFEGKDKPGIAWGWNQSLRLVVKGKKSGNKMHEITAYNPADAGKLLGDNVFGLNWIPMPDGFPIPELLLP